MTASHSRGDERAGATIAQLRGDIDRGLTGDKSGGFDPAAAPLGTDDEAAGDPPGPDALARARAQACAGVRSTATANAATPELPPDGSLPPQRGLALAALAGVAAGAVLGALLLAAL